jgi:hypothetical protein
MRPSSDEIAHLKTKILSLSVADYPSPMTIEDLCYIAEIDAWAVAEVIARCLLEHECDDRPSAV